MGRKQLHGQVPDCGRISSTPRRGLFRRSPPAISAICACAGRSRCAIRRRGEQHVTASYREEAGDSLERLTFHARHCDLIVMGRAKQKQGLAQDTLERLVLVCGRPMLVAATAAPQRLTGTIMVCKFADNSDPLRGIIAANSDPF